jgi:hypothetical protein
MSIDDLWYKNAVIYWRDTSLVTLHNVANRDVKVKLKIGVDPMTCSRTVS